MKYIKLFKTSSEIGAGVEVTTPNVSYLRGANGIAIPGNNDTAIVKYNSSTGKIESAIDYSSKYLTFEALEAGTFMFSNAINYSIDNGSTWVSLAANTYTPTINAGSNIMWKGTLIPQTDDGIGHFGSTGNFNAYGNVMSLLYGDNFANQTDLTEKPYAFASLFENNTNIIGAENLILPAITLARNSYSYMFKGCESLTTAPTLPATTLAQNCYFRMFFNCTSLTTAPELPSTTLATGCYTHMFKYCESLITAPELPATTLVEDCYNGMIAYCSLLTYIKMLATDISANGCLADWVDGVAATGTFVKNTAMTDLPTGTSGIPSGWTVQDATS